MSTLATATGTLPGAAAEAALLLALIALLIAGDLASGYAPDRAARVFGVGALPLALTFAALLVFRFAA